MQRPLPRYMAHPTSSENTAITVCVLLFFPYIFVYMYTCVSILINCCSGFV